MKLQLATVTALACGLALFAPTPSSAAIINGSQLNINGSAIVGATFLNWLCTEPGDVVCGPVNTSPGQGDFLSAGSTGTFAQYNGTFGLIKDINNASQPLNTLFSLPNFITFELNNQETVELTFIPLGTDPASTTCAGLQHCTPSNGALVTGTNPAGLSAFNLDQNGTGTAATFGIFGVVHETGGATANIAGTFTAQFTGLTPQQVLAAALAGTPSTYSAQLVLTTVPEPTAILLSGLGLLTLGLIRRKARP